MGHLIRAMGTGVVRWTPPVLLAVLSAGALAPVLVSGVGLAGAGLGAVSAIGGNVLTDLIKAGLSRLTVTGRKPSAEEVAAEIRQRIQEVLEAGGEHAETLRRDIARLTREFGLAEAAIDAAVQVGDRELQSALTAGLAGLSEEFAEFAFVMSAMERHLRSLQEGIDRNQAELQLAVSLQYQQATDTRLLLNLLSLIERRTRHEHETPNGGETPRWSDGSPYQGLAPFGEADAEVFAGRDIATAELVSILSRRPAASGPLVVTGASGAGKSSLLRAGLLPAIARGDLSREAGHWPRHVIEPQPRSPMSALATLLAGLAGLAAPDVLDTLTADPDRAHLLVRQALGQDARRRSLPAETVSKARLVLIVDQFEQVFTGDDETATAERLAFIRALHAMATIPSGPDDVPSALVMIAVRGDFIDRCAGHPELAVALRDPFVLGSMTETELRIAITRPADVAGLDIEPGLVDTILSELRSPSGGYEPGALPLLSQSMLTVWEHREGNRLTSRGYALTGGVTQAVTTSAEAAYDSLGASERDLARRLFQQLTTVSPGNRLARRAVRLPDLRAAFDEADRAQVDHVLELFARRRLIVVDAASVQISHDTLLRTWPRLTGWLEADLAAHALRSQLLDDADEWDRDGRHASYLYRGERLAAIVHAEQRWQTGRLGPSPLTGVPKTFLDAAVRAEERGRRQRRLALVTLSTLLAAAVVLAGVALIQSRAVREQRQVALKQQRVATARLLVSEAEAARTTDPRLALLLGISAESVQSDPQTRASLVGTLTATRYAGTLGEYSDTVDSVVFSPGGRLLATTSRIETTKPIPSCDGTACSAGGPSCPDGQTSCQPATPSHQPTVTTSVYGAVVLWDLSDRVRPRRLGAPLVIDNAQTALVTFAPTGHLMATNDDGGRAVTLWDISDPAKPVRRGSSPSGTYDDVTAIAFSPDGRTLAVGRDAHRVELWDVSDPTRVTRRSSSLAGLTKNVESVSFSPDGRALAAASDDEVLLWRLTDPAQQPIRLASPIKVGAPAAFSFDGRLLATRVQDVKANKRAQFALWDVTKAVPTRIGPALTGNNNTFALSPKAATMAVTGYDGTIALWDISDPSHPVQATSPLSAHTDWVMSAAFSSDGRTLATGGRDKTVILWNLSDNGRPAQRGKTLEGADAMTFRPNGTVLASGSRRGVVSLWDLTDPARPGEIGATVPGSNTTLSPDGRLLATGGSNGAVTVWDLSDAAHPVQRGVPLSAAAAPAMFSPDGRMLITGDANTSTLWDLSDPMHPVRVERDLPAVIVLVAAFTPDSRTLAVGNIYDFDGKLTLWDVSNPAHPAKRTVPILTGDTSDVTSVTFSANSRIMAAGRSDDKIVLWNISDQKRPVRIGQPLAGVADPNKGIMSLASSISTSGMAFSPNGRILASVDIAGSLSLWDVTDPAAPHRLTALMSLPDKDLRALTFAPDGRSLAVGTFHGSVSRWDISGIVDLQSHAVERACAITGHGLDPMQWAQFIPGLPYQETCR
ncbi:UNVERIFIED_ORG: WD40 repeat protein [Microbispora rosea subsp. rosea]